MESIINSLLQLFALALVIERIVDVIHKVFSVPPRHPQSSPDWGVPGTVLSFIFGLIVCYAYGFDVIKVITGGQTNEYVGMLLSALVIAGGSAGVRAIIEVLRAISKANRLESEARSLQAMRLIKTYTRSVEDADVPTPDLLRDSPLNPLNLLTAISDRPAKATKLYDAQGTYRRGCSEFVCSVLGLAFEQANDLMGDAPQEITDWSKVKAGAIVGWKNPSGSGHVSVYVKDGVSTYIDVREPATSDNPDPKPRRLGSYGPKQKMYLSSRFGS